MKAFAYIRCSGISQMSMDGPIRQREAIQKYAAEKGIEIVREYQESFTGTDLEGRPEFRQMRIDLLSNGVRLVIVEKLDRLARDLMIQETIIADFRKNGIDLKSATPGEEDLCSTDPTRKLIRQILGAVAEFDRSMLVARMSKGKARVRAQGVRCGGQAPYGAHKHHPEELAIVNRVNHLRRAGYNISKITETLNAEGFKTRKGTRFFPEQIARLLRRGSRNLPTTVTTAT